MSKKVAIFTTFFEATSGYSLIGVAETQIRMLLEHGYDPVVLVQENFTQPEPPTIWAPEQIDLRPVLPALDLGRDVPDDFEDRVASIKTALEIALADVNVCITHDIVLQPFYLSHNAAMREYARIRPDLLWLHWLHSRPTQGGNDDYPRNLRWTTPPGYLVYPNSYDMSQVARIYGCGGQEWRVKACRAAHALDPLLLWKYDPLTLDLARKADMAGGDIVCVYPVRLDRGKQPEKIVRLMKGVKKAGYEPRLLVIDWQSAGAHFQKYIDELLELARSMHIEECINFTSRLNDDCSQGVPRHVVTELMDMSNVYVHPSSVETYSLTTHEAMLRGLLCVLNHDWPPMRELFGDNAIYMDFSSDIVGRNYDPSEQAFWNDEALRLVSELKSNRAAWAKTVARKEWSPQALWKDFETLLYLTPVGE